VARPRAVVIGAGIGGLAAAAGLCSAGWDVTACERATSLEPVGAGLALGPNGLRALDVIGAGNPLRALAIPQELGIRRSDGRWLMRSATGHMIADRFGDPVILVPRAAVINALTARVPGGVLSLGTEVTSVEPGGNAAARISSTAGQLEADLVVAAYGIGSATRSALFPGHPGLRPAGLTTWRLLTAPVTGGAAPSSASCRCPTGGSTATPPRPQLPAPAPGNRLPRTTDVVRCPV
jgi:2-polyprenyl-6-methoxyphenol hydroxylase-like FAD-dependent oxidoreductase